MYVDNDNEWNELYPKVVLFFLNKDNFISKDQYAKGFVSKGFIVSMSNQIKLQYLPCHMVELLSPFTLFKLHF